MKRYLFILCFTTQLLFAHGHPLSGLVDPNDPMVRAVRCCEKSGASCGRGFQQAYQGAAWVGRGIVQGLFYVPGVSYVSLAVAKWAVDQMPLP
jgi:hypothetical protein